jgi:hypothetical protein
MALGAGQPPGVTPKQVVFLFMAGTVTAVVAFLFGVLVGRGAPVTGPADAGSEGPARDDRPALAGGGALEESAGGFDGEGLSYYYRLAGEAAAEESLRVPGLPEAEAPGPLRRSTGSTDSTEDGLTVQIAALPDRDLAQQIADRLVDKGFPAFVADPANDAPVAMYRVRVGSYTDHGVAERMKRRLETEEHFQPWITR